MLWAQMSTEMAPISETFSSNARFMVRSFSYDDTFPNLKGESFVYENDENGNKKEMYRIPRSFDLYDGYPYFLAVSNDGKKITQIVRIW